MYFLRNFKKRIENNKIIRQMDDRITQFRNLNSRERNVLEIFDYRTNTNINKSKILVTCEHASNEVHKYRINENNKPFFSSHWGYDVGAKDMTVELCERLELFSICSRFSRLLIDPNRSLLSDTLIRKYVEKNIEIDINKDENCDREKRIEIFYMEYYKILAEVIEFLRPNYILSIHSFTPFYEDNPERKFEIGILFRKRGKLVDSIEKAFRDNDVVYRLNEPYDANDGLCHALDCMTSYRYPEITEGVLLEIRNDFCQNSEWRDRIIDILKPTIDNLKL